jgi:hypothetical protein
MYSTQRPILSFAFACPPDRRRRLARSRFIPRLEALEGKVLPSTLTVTNVFDDGSQGSLRYEMGQANPGDIVNFDPALSGRLIGLQQGRLVVDRDLTITAAGLSQGITIFGNQASGIFFVPQGVTATLEGLTLSNGKAPMGSGGGGILNQGTLTVESCRIVNNTVTSQYFQFGGGGIFNDQGTLTILNSLIGDNFDHGNAGAGSGLYSRGGVVDLSNSQISGNTMGGVENDNGTLVFTQAEVSGNGSLGVYNVGTGVFTFSQVTISGNTGSGIYSFASAAQEPSTLQDSVVSDNNGFSGGGISNNGPLIVIGCVVSHNHAGVGGGIQNSSSGNLEIDHSAIVGNVAQVNGGIDNQSALTITDSTITDNTALSGGGIGLSIFGRLTLERSTVSGNRALGNGARGGGISIASATQATATIDNSTISGNSSDGDGGGIYLGSNSQLTVVSSTIAFNQTGSPWYAGQGGGFWAAANTGTLQIRNTIVAGNAAGGGGADVQGAVTSQGYNLIQDVSGTAITGDETGNLYGVDPLLYTLADNGGPTPTHALLDGSPAIGAGDPALAGTTDQRGVTRPDAVDMGAYQTEPSSGTVHPDRQHFAIAALDPLFGNGLLERPEPGTILPVRETSSRGVSRLDLIAASGTDVGSARHSSHRVGERSVAGLEALDPDLTLEVLR